MKTIKKEVLDWLENQEDEKSSLEDLQQYGCISGMVSDLIYYYDTCKFYKAHKKEIFEITEDFLNSTGMSLKEFFLCSNNFPLAKEEIERENFINGIEGIIKHNKDVKDQIENWFSWFAFEETARAYYESKYELIS